MLDDDMIEEPTTEKEALQAVCRGRRISLDKWNDNKDIVMAANLNTQFCALDRLSDKLKDDQEVVIEMVKDWPMNLEFASDRLKNDKEIVLEAVRKDSMCLRFASKEIQELCKGTNAVKTLETHILAEDLRANLVNSNASKQRRMKV